jgi:hypothetical protein
VKTKIHLWSFLAQFFLELEKFRTEIVEKIETNISCSINLLFENFAIYEVTWKCIVERGRPQMTTWPLRIAGWIPKTTNTLRILVCNNNYCFFTATMVSRTGISVTLHLQCLPACNLDGVYLCVTNWIFKYNSGYFSLSNVNSVQIRTFCFFKIHFTNSFPLRSISARRVVIMTWL